MMPYKSILCLNGDLPDSSFFVGNERIIAVDGAADKLLQMGIAPDVIIGDLDSIKQSHYSSSEVIHLPSQDQSDFQKSIDYLKQNKLLPTLVCGASGGFIDHILFNINIILENECIFYAPPLIGYTLKGPVVLQFNFTKNTKISLLGIPKAKISTSGLKWELKETSLEFPGFNSAFNRTIAENISIQILEGAVLMLVYAEHIEDMGAICKN